MTKKDDMMPVYLVLGGVMFILVLLLAGNLAFYQMYGLDGIQRAFDDMMRFRFHIGFDSVYLKYYGAGASLYVIAALLIYGVTRNSGMMQQVSKAVLQNGLPATVIITGSMRIRSGKRPVMGR